MHARHWLPATLVFVFASTAMFPSALSLPQHGDERMYVWKAAYYADRLARLDFAGGNPASYTDPGWSPWSFWAHEQPWGSHAIYALVMSAFRAPAPSLPYSWDDPLLQGPPTDIPAATLPLVRGTAVLCAALGLALITLRLGWPAAIAALLFLLIPHVRTDLARAWAEGPLLLGFGLSVLAFGSPWFPVCVGLATGFKLTAIVLWPIVWFTAPLPFRHLRHFANVAVASVAFAVTTPYSWQAGGPLYLVWLLFVRLNMYADQSRSIGGPLGLFLPTRYFWPLKLAALVSAVMLLARWREKRPAQ